MSLFSWLRGLFERKPKKAALVHAAAPTSPTWQFVVVDVDAQLPVAEVAAYASAQQKQIASQWALYWRSTGTVRVASKDHPPVAGEVQVLLHKSAPKDQTDALGFHDRQPDGTPLMHIFLDLCAQYGDKWTSVSSHEVLETLGDPYLTLAAQTDAGFMAVEVCDAVEATSCTIDGVALSNFCLPAYFEPNVHAEKEQYDWLSLLTKPYSLLPGGYSQLFDPAKGWVQTTAARPYRARVATLGLSRGARRAG